MKEAYFSYKRAKIFFRERGTLKQRNKGEKRANTSFLTRSSKTQPNSQQTDRKVTIFRQIIKNIFFGAMKMKAAYFATENETAVLL